MNYVIFHEDTTDRKNGTEVYVHAIQNERSTLVEIADKVTSAMKFPTAREAYEWAGSRHLDWWKVGKR
jgi:hypothetical protein